MNANVKKQIRGALKALTLILNAVALIALGVFAGIYLFVLVYIP